MLLVCTLIKDKARLNARQSLILLALAQPTTRCFNHAYPHFVIGWDYTADYSGDIVETTNFAKDENIEKNKGTLTKIKM